LRLFLVFDYAQYNIWRTFEINEYFMPELQVKTRKLTQSWKF